MKSRNSIILKIVLGLVVIVVVVGITMVSDIAKQANTPEPSAIEVAQVSPSPTVLPTATIAPTATAAPADTPIPAYIPAPDELIEFEFANLSLKKGSLTYTASYGDITAEWNVNESADYYVLYALDENDIVYHKDILWPDIDSWNISNIRPGNILLLSYQDMGEKSAQDDVLLDSQFQMIVAGDARLTSDEPLQNKYYILIDKEDFTIGIFTYDENGQYTKLVEAFPCAIGRSARMTALGVFEISSKGAWKRWNSSQYSPYYTKYTSGVYIHGPIYRSKKFNTLLAKSYNAIGKAATSGCLRTTVEASMWIYYNCPAGTVIEVVKSSDLVDHVERVPLDNQYPKWDPTDTEKPVPTPAPTPTPNPIPTATPTAN